MEKHILLVDDSTTIRLSVGLFLRRANYRVTEAVNGRDALEKLEAMRQHDDFVSLVLTDVNMPEMDGITLIRKLREGHFRFVPILVLTTETDASRVEEGMAAGASGWFRKPFHAEQLLRAIEKLIWSK
jgi:two-component system, chemotaxis family, chemotaxis protein CheY